MGGQGRAEKAADDGLGCSGSGAGGVGADREASEGRGDGDGGTGGSSSSKSLDAVRDAQGAASPVVGAHAATSTSQHAATARMATSGDGQRPVRANAGAQGLTNSRQLLATAAQRQSADKVGVGEDRTVAGLAGASHGDGSRDSAAGVSHMESGRATQDAASSGAASSDVTLSNDVALSSILPESLRPDQASVIRQLSLARAEHRPEEPTNIAALAALLPEQDIGLQREVQVQAGLGVHGPALSARQPSRGHSRLESVLMQLLAEAQGGAQSSDVLVEHLRAQLRSEDVVLECARLGLHFPGASAALSASAGGSAQVGDGGIGNPRSVLDLQGKLSAMLAAALQAEGYDAGAGAAIPVGAPDKMPNSETNDLGPLTASKASLPSKGLALDERRQNDVSNTHLTGSAPVVARHAQLPQLSQLSPTNSGATGAFSGGVGALGLDALLGAKPLANLEPSPSGVLRLLNAGSGSSVSAALLSTLLCVCVCTYARVCVCVYVCMYICMCVCVYVCICMYVCMYVCMCVCMCVCVYVCMYVCMCVCVCVCVCAYAHTQVSYT